MKIPRAVLLVILLLACALWYWLARCGPSPLASSGDGAGSEPGGAPLPQTIQLAVLNGSGEPGLARRLSRQLAALGCVILTVADAPHDSFRESLLINRRLPPESAEKLASGLDGIPVLKEWDPRCPEDAVLVVGHDHGRLFESLLLGPLKGY